MNKPKPNSISKSYKIDKDVYHKTKIYCAQKDIFVSELIENLLKRELKIK